MSLRRGIVAALLLVACSGRSGTEVVGGSDACCADAAPDEAGDATFDADAPGDAAADAPDVGCVAACDAAQNVGCASDDLGDCVLSCDDLASGYPACLPQMTSFETCVASAPPSDWSCDQDGFAALSSCQSEKSARDACLAAGR